jgi:hypothetical protein
MFLLQLSDFGSVWSSSSDFLLVFFVTLLFPSIPLSPKWNLIELQAPDRDTCCAYLSSISVAVDESKGCNVALLSL